ncbi:MAG: preprotein translocase subunit SecG [bacterium]|nr:preprotein translocase subunit SecG [bacterium]
MFQQVFVNKELWSQIFSVAQLIVSVVLIILILLQERSSGLSGVFGGDNAGFYQTRRGLEKIIFRSTIVLVCAFIVLALLNLIV